MNYRQIACDYLGAEDEQIVVCRVDGEELVVVVNKGGAGSPKYRIPLKNLPEPEPEPKAAEAKPPAKPKAAPRPPAKRRGRPPAKEA
jgi:hypothetical protein